MYLIVTSFVCGANISPAQGIDKVTPVIAKSTLQLRLSRALLVIKKIIELRLKKNF